MTLQTSTMTSKKTEMIGERNFLTIPEGGEEQKINK